MQVLKLPAIAGLIWINAGFRLMFQQFFRIFSLVVMYFFGLVLINLIASVLATTLATAEADQDLVARIVLFGFSILTPVVSIGFMDACRAATRGERITPWYFFHGFNVSRPALLSLLGLGLFQISALTVVTAFLPKLPEVSFADLANNSAAATAATDADSMLVSLAIVVPVLLIFVLIWYAPMLAAWHGMRPIKAMFFSIAACWRNKAAFLVFGAGWLMIGMFLSLFVVTIVGAFGVSNITQTFAAMLVMILIGAMNCSVYMTYSSVFATAQKPAAA